MALLTAPSAHAQGVIEGTILDGSRGETLPGASVSLVGTQRGATTDAQGYFQIEDVAPGTYTLRASFVGFATATEEDVVVRTGETTTVDLALQADTEALEEVVVVGYGTERREDVTGAISSVSAEELENDVGSTIDQALQGRIAGATVVRNTGRPGGDVSIRIRGLSTINTGSDEPLYVIDGVPIGGDSENGITNPLATLNPQDIQSVDILKSASAAAIYGSRASNGVVLITTKSGQSNEFQVSYNASVGTQALPRQVDVMNLRQFAQFSTERAEVVGYTSDASLTNPSLLGEGTNWQDALFQRASSTDHNLSVSGGNEETTFRLSGGYTYEEGIAIESDFQRYSLNMRLDNESVDWLNTGARMNLSRTDQNINVSQDDIINLAIRQRPDIAVRTPDGGYGGPESSEFSLNNPVGLAQLNSNEEMNTQAVGGVYANIDFLDNLTLNNELDGSFNYGGGYVFNPAFSFGALTNDVSEASRSSSNSTFWQLRNYLNYRTSLGGVNAEAMGGHEILASRYEGLSGGRRDFPSDAIQELVGGDAATATNGSFAGSSSLQSAFGRLRLSYDDRYFLTGNFRADASSNFSPENRWGYFPSVSGAWKISSESFMDDVDFIDQLKLRAGYGEVGNQNIGQYPFGDTYVVIPTQWGNGVRSGNLGNPSVRWEATKSVDVGLDVGLFERRVNLTVDAYDKTVDGLLLQVPLPLYAGTGGTGSLGAPIDNIGSMRNRGVEVSLNTVNLEGGFQWDSNVVFTMNRNEVTALNSDDDFIDRNISFFDTATRTVVGEPAAQFYGYRVAGMFESEEELIQARNGEGELALPEGSEEGVPMPISETDGTWIGDLRFEDLNDDGVIDEQDRTFIGNPTPDFQFGVTNNFSFKGFDLSVFLNGNYGNEILNQVRRQNEDPASNFGLLESLFDYARVEMVDPEGSATDPGNYRLANPGTSVPRITGTDPNDNQRVSDRWIEDGSYLRIQNVTLGYRLPGDMTNRFGLRGLRLFGTVTNLYTLTGYSGYDPEIGATRSGNYTNNPLLRGIDTGRYPLPRTFTLGLNVNL